MEIMLHYDPWSKKIRSVKLVSSELNFAVAVGNATEHDSIQDFTEKVPVAVVTVFVSVFWSSNDFGQSA